MAVAKKAKKDGVEVKIETSNDAQKDKKHSKRKTKTATLETSGLTLSIESVEPEKTSKKAVKAKKVKGEKTPKTAELQAVPEESPAAAAEPVKPTRLRKSAKKVVAKADADDLNTPEYPAGDEKAKPVRKTRAAKKTEPSEETLPAAEASAAAEGKKAVRARKVKTVKAKAPAEELSAEQAEAAPVKTPKSKAAKPKAAKSTAKSKGRKKSAKPVDADSEDFDFDDDGGEDIAGVIDDEDADYEDIPELDEVEDIEAVEDVGDETDEDGAADAEAAPSEAEPEAAPKKTRRSKKSRAARDKALMEAMKHGYGAAEESTEDRRSKLIKLISLGKERGYVTYSEINDNIPNTLLDEDAIETIVNILGNLNIAVHEVAPDEEQLLIQGGAEGVSDEDAEAEAEAALSTVESEFGRTTDPVRIYMREMGSVELLSRQDEIEISKRIEDGLKHMVLAIARCPVTVHEILESAERIRSGETPIDEVVDGIVTPDDQKNVVGAVEDETDMGASAMTVGQLED